MSNAFGPNSAYSFEGGICRNAAPVPDRWGLLTEVTPRDPGNWREAADRLAVELRRKRVCVLTGAGLSTEAGIPDYRGGGTARRARNPIRFEEFIGDAALRKRYWARAFVGYLAIERATPSDGHRALRKLEERGGVGSLITQNVDGLHRKAGSDAVELHGRLSEVVCLGCGKRTERQAVQDDLRRSNPWLGEVVAPLAPDGDADFPDELLENLRVPACQHCGGALKPNVVFFGEAVPRPRVDTAFEQLRAAEALLVVGSSLTVFSGFRFPRQARESKMPVYLINVGPTRADEFARLKVEGLAGPVLAHLQQALSG